MIGRMVIALVEVSKLVDGKRISWTLPLAAWLNTEELNSLLKELNCHVRKSGSLQQGQGCLK